MTDSAMYLGQALQTVANVVSRAGQVIPVIDHAAQGVLNPTGQAALLDRIAADLIDIERKAANALEAVRKAQAVAREAAQ